MSWSTSRAPASSGVAPKVLEEARALFERRKGDAANATDVECLELLRSALGPSDATTSGSGRRLAPQLALVLASSHHVLHDRSQLGSDVGSTRK